MTPDIATGHADRGAAATPSMAGWTLTLRFGLELAALVGLGVGAWSVASGPARYLAAAVVPSAAAAVWGVFNVADDPSRSGAAPVGVPGWARLSIEAAILGAGAGGFAVAGRPAVGLTLAALTAVHYGSTTARLAWLLDR